MASSSNTPRSASRPRPKRSTTNLSNLRLAPLSTKFSEPTKGNSTSRSPYEESPEATFSRQHPSYLQGRSAPTTPGILSRSSSRRQLSGGGLSRRGSLYDNVNATEQSGYEYAVIRRDDSGSARNGTGSGLLPKAKSEAALLVQQRSSAKGVQLRKTKLVTIKPNGESLAPRSKPVEDDWLTRTGAATNALLQESKGQSWLASRHSSASLAGQISEDDDDQYEEMAALSASSAKLHIPSPTLSPVSHRRSNWGSRYGSRSASRRGSRRGSVAHVRTPVVGMTPVTGDVITGYFDGDPLAMPIEPDFVDPEEGDSDQDEAEVASLTRDKSFGLGAVVDKLMAFNLFKVDEHGETSDQDLETSSGTEKDAKMQALAAMRKRAEQERLMSAQAPKDGAAESEQGGGWKDAAFLMSVASKAMFQ